MGRARTLISLAVVFTVAFAGTAVANHVYNDVPTSSVFHDEIAEIGGQQCADGFPGGLFKPEDPVKRQQMARFLSRCGGRVSADTGTANVMGVSGAEFVITEVPFTATADGYVVVTATGTTSSSQEGLCPCAVSWRLRDNTNGVYAAVPARGQLDSSAAQSGDTYESMATTAVFAIAQGDTNTYQVRGEWADTDVTAMNFEASLTVEFFPFAGASD